ncbi:MAG: thioredoxin family protein [Pyrinomonadaceae bacterium]|nr:thioredoxin family protein [Pyrinomonadaceae bacterium]
MKAFLSSKLFTILLFLAIPASAYFINVEVQSYLGRRAFEGTGLKSHSLQESMSRAKAEGKQILVDVSAIWCGTCRKLDNEVFAKDEVKKVIDKKYIFTRLEYESAEGEAFLKKHNVKSFPTLWLLDENGTTIKRLKVTFKPAEFIRQLD